MLAWIAARIAKAVLGIGWDEATGRVLWVGTMDRSDSLLEIVSWLGWSANADELEFVEQNVGRKWLHHELICAGE